MLAKAVKKGVALRFMPAGKPAFALFVEETKLIKTN